MMTEDGRNQFTPRLMHRSLHRILSLHEEIELPIRICAYSRSCDIPPVRSNNEGTENCHLLAPCNPLQISGIKNRHSGGQPDSLFRSQIYSHMGPAYCAYRAC